MNLSKPLEREVEIGGATYEVNLAFDNVLNLLDILQSPYVSAGEKVMQGIYLLLGTTLDIKAEHQVKVFQTLLEKFVREGEDKEQHVDLAGNPMPAEQTAPTYDLSHDANYIYTSFMQAYNINLFKEQGKLDWREFKALLQDLPDETKFKKVIDIRTRPYPKGKGTSEERQQLKTLKQAFALPNEVID